MLATDIPNGELRIPVIRSPECRSVFSDQAIVTASTEGPDTVVVVSFLRKDGLPGQEIAQIERDGSGPGAHTVTGTRFDTAIRKICEAEVLMSPDKLMRTAEAIIKNSLKLDPEIREHYGIPETWKRISALLEGAK